MSPDWKRQQDRDAHMPMVVFCIHVAKHQMPKGRFFITENPTTNAMWRVPDMVVLAGRPGTDWGHFEHVRIWHAGSKHTGSLLQTCVAVPQGSSFLKVQAESCTRTH